MKALQIQVFVFFGIELNDRPLWAHPAKKSPFPVRREGAIWLWDDAGEEGNTPLQAPTNVHKPLGYYQ
jgi:hypothetical protein